MKNKKTLIIVFIIFIFIIGGIIYIKNKNTNNNTDTDSIVFEQESFSCKVGDKISTVVTVEYKQGENLKFEYESKNPEIATIAKSAENVKCMNCILVEIKCLKEGNTSVVVKAYDKTKTASVTVKK